MKALFRYLILLIFGGIIIPIYQLTGPHIGGPAVKSIVVQNALSDSEKTYPGFSFKDDVAAKLLPVLKYF